MKYHRSLSTYIEILKSSGFQIENLVEPKPDEEMMNMVEMKDELRRPMMLIIACFKK